MRLPAMAVSLALVVAGRGGGGSESFSAPAAFSCLKGAGVDVDRAGADYVAQTASEGSALLNVEGANVNVAFGGDSDEAKSLVDQYAAFGEAGEIEQRGNVVLVWDDAPTSEQEELVEGCLKE